MWLKMCLRLKELLVSIPVQLYSIQRNIAIILSEMWIDFYPENIDIS